MTMVTMMMCHRHSLPSAALIVLIALIVHASVTPVEAFQHSLQRATAHRSHSHRSHPQGSNNRCRCDLPSTTACCAQLADRMIGLDAPTVWHEFSPLANQHQSINLGQGFPDWDPPQFCIDAMAQATQPSFERNANQYARSAAHLPLAQVLAQEYTQRWQNSIEIDPITQIATATGCTNALYCALQGLINPGDEVLLMEPAFDIYTAQVKMAGGTCIYCPLRERDDDDDVARTASSVFYLDLEELDSKLTQKTKVLLLNTPHNPTGKVFTREELQDLAKLLLDKYPNVIVIADEVYEHIVFEDPNSGGKPVEHVSMATIDGMWDRTLTLSSSGKTFSCTGWKVGWAVGPDALVQAVRSTQQWVSFSAATPTQDAIALSMQEAKLPYEGFDSYYAFLANSYQRKREILMQCLQLAGMNPLLPSGAFFIMADTSSIEFPYAQRYADMVTAAMPSHPMPRDWALSRWMTEEIGVTSIPPSAFYSSPNVPLASNLLRFAFCKGDDTLLQARERFRDYFGGHA